MTVPIHSTHVICDDTVYYLDGPQQSRPADGTFPTGTRVTLLEHAPAYSRVRSECGITASVDTSALKLLGAPLVSE